MYEIIERFSHGKRKIELFGLDRNLREGWVTVGNDLHLNNFSLEEYNHALDAKHNARKSMPEEEVQKLVVRVPQTAHEATQGSLQWFTNILDHSLPVRS